MSIDWRLTLFFFFEFVQSVIIKCISLCFCAIPLFLTVTRLNVLYAYFFFIKGYFFHVTSYFSLFKLVLVLFFAFLLNYMDVKLGFSLLNT